MEAFISRVPSRQVLIGTDSITNLHKLEQVSSDEGIGTLAENLLEALREHPDVNKKIDAARRETRAEKKRMAMAMRQKALGTLGMTVKPRVGPRDLAQPPEKEVAVAQSLVLWDRAGVGDGEDEGWTGLGGRRSRCAGYLLDFSPSFVFPTSPRDVTVLLCR